MAIDGISGARSSYRENWENNGGAYGNEGTEGTEGSNGTSHIWDAVFTDKKENAVSVDDFLSLMVAQMTNQDFMNPMDDTQFLSQLAQFSSMQYMQELANYSKQNYVSSLVGQTITASKFTNAGGLDTTTGVVTKISLVDDEYLVYIGDKSYTLDQIMEIGVSSGGSSGSTTPGDGTDEETQYFYLTLLGQPVTVKDADGNEVSGTVDRVSMTDGIKLMVNGEWYKAADLVSVDAATDGTGGTDTDETVERDPEEEAALAMFAAMRGIDINGEESEEDDGVDLGFFR